MSTLTTLINKLSELAENDANISEFIKNNKKNYSKNAKLIIYDELGEIFSGSVEMFHKNYLDERAKLESRVVLDLNYIDGCFYVGLK